MEEDPDYHLTKPTLSEDLPTAAKQAYALFATGWEDPTKSRFKLLNELADSFMRLDLPFEAKKIYDHTLSKTDIPQIKAACYLGLGVLMEKIYNFEDAVGYYSKIFLEDVDIEMPSGSHLLYFANNNLGYSLNQLNRYKEAESFCRQAAVINPMRPNAYKNLGASLEGQGRFVEAAFSYVTAVQASASDARALKHLEDMVLRHPELHQKIFDLKHWIESCREIVIHVRTQNTQDQ